MFDSAIVEESVSYVTLSYKNSIYGYIAFYGDYTFPAIGGVKIVHETVSLNAREHCIALAKTMYKKAQAAKLPLSGAKAILFINDQSERSEILKNFAQTLNTFAGKYITAVDVGSSEIDMNYILQFTPYVTCNSQAGGDPSPYTAKTVILAIQSTCKRMFRFSCLQKQRIVIQGLGKVGSQLLKQLNEHDEDFDITIFDIDHSKALAYAKQYRCQAISVENCYQFPCDIFICAAVSFLIDQQAVSQLNCKIFACAANNPFTDTRAKIQLKSKNICLLDDYLINSGGLIYCAYQFGVIKQLRPYIERVSTLTHCA